MAIYSEPSSEVTGALITAAKWNQNIVDNVIAVHDMVYDLVTVAEVQTSGTNASGTFTHGGWRTRVLNSLVDSNNIGASLGSNQVTLPAGTYDVTASAPAGTSSSTGCGAHQIRLYNITTATTITAGTSANSESQSYGRSQITNYRMVLATTTVIELQHRCTTTPFANGFGMACGFGEAETYATVSFRRIAVG